MENSCFGPETKGVHLRSVPLGPQPVLEANLQRHAGDGILARGQRLRPRMAANARHSKAGQLKPEHERAYFQRPRPVLELYDLDADPGELNNVAGRAEHRDIQQTLTAAMQEKMITDYDFIPPVMTEDPEPAAGQRRQ